MVRKGGIKVKITYAVEEIIIERTEHLHQGYTKIQNLTRQVWVTRGHGPTKEPN